MTIKTATVCDICGAEFNITKNTLVERSLELTKSSITYTVDATFLCCPRCGKEYPVILDDVDSKATLEKLREIQHKRFKYLSRGKSVPTRLAERYKITNRKLDFQRQQIAEKFNGAVYQLDGDTIQLDYRYHAR